MRSNFTKLRLLLSALLSLGFLGTIASVVGIAGGLNSLFGGGSDPGSQQMTNPTGGAATGSTGAMNTVYPADLAAYQKLLTIDPSQYVQSGNQAGTQYGDLATIARQYMQMLQGQAGVSQGAQQTLMNSGNQAFAAGQDPQNALYQHLLQQTQDQSRAATSMRGIGTSPESAGIENQAVGRFNMDWQNQQLARMLQGLGGQTSAYNAAGNQAQLTGANLSGAMNFGAQQPGYTMQAGQIPFQTQQTAYGAPIAAGTQYATGLNTAFNPNLAAFNQGQFGLGAQQSATGMNSLLTGLSQANQPGGWLQTAFGGGSGPVGVQGNGAMTPSYDYASYSNPYAQSDIYGGN